MNFLDMEAAAMLAQYMRSIKVGAIPLPQAYGFTIPAAVAHDQVEIIGMNVPGLVRKIHLNPGLVVVLDFTEEFTPIGPEAMVADVDTVSVPVFVTHAFLFAAGADHVYLARVEVQTPDAVIHQLPGAFMTESKQVRLGGRGIDMPDPAPFLPGDLSAHSAGI
jgi:hypothetical protein